MQLVTLNSQETETMLTLIHLSPFYATSPPTPPPPPPPVNDASQGLEWVFWAQLT